LISYARTYPLAVAGNTTFIRFNLTTADFTLQFEADTNINEPTEIYLSEDLHYPEGYEVLISPSRKADWKKASTNKIIVFTNHLTNFGEKIQVKIMKKNKEILS